MRIGVISDIHANLSALDAVLAHAPALDVIWCLGDIVGYGPQPEEVIQRLQTLRHAAVAGNHDWAVLGRLSIADFNPDAAAAVRWTAARLSASARGYLQALPQRRIEDAFTLVHGSPRNPLWEYLLSVPGATASFGHFTTPWCLVGHTHIPSLFIQRDKGRVEAAYAPPDFHLPLDPSQRCILNPGSVGQPRDGDPRAAYLIIDTDRAVATWHRVPYDIGATQELMNRYRLPKRLITRLAEGR